LQFLDAPCQRALKTNNTLKGKDNKMAKRVLNTNGQYRKSSKLAALLVIGLFLSTSMICFAESPNQSGKPFQYGDNNPLAPFAYHASRGLTYIGKVVDTKTRRRFGSEYVKAIKFEVIEPLSGFGKLPPPKYLKLKGEFPDILSNQLYFVDTNYRGLTALIPLEDKRQLVNEITQIWRRGSTRRAIVEEIADEIVRKGRPDWKKCRIYDPVDLSLIETPGWKLASGREGIQFIYGCGIGKKIEPYILIQSLKIDGNQTWVEGIIQPNSVRFKAELIDLKNGTGFNIKSLFLSGYLSAVTLYDAAFRGDITEVKRLIEQGADVNAPDAEHRIGLTPLHYAAENGHSDTVALLIERGASVSARNRYGGTPLHTAAEHGHKDVVGLLSERGARITARDLYGRTPLHGAASRGHRDVAELLIAKGADVNEKTEDGGTPLHKAASRDHRDVAELLIAKGADVNEKTKDGRTPLHEAAISGFKEVIELLIAKGAEVNALDKRRRTPYYYATRRHFKGFTDAAELLRRHGGEK
jgi:ankyrin repeat protein